MEADFGDCGQEFHLKADSDSGRSQIDTELGKGKAHEPYELMAWTTPASAA